MVHLRVAGGDFVEGVESLDALAGGEIVDLDTAVGHRGQAFGETLRAGTETGEIPWPGRYHGNFDSILGDGRCRDRAGPGCQSGGDAPFEYITTFHC